MQALPIMISGAAALGIGFGLGSFFPGKIGGTNAPFAEEEVQAVTFEGGPARQGADRDSAAAFRQKFGIYPNRSYAAAKDRLEELFEAVERYRDWRPGKIGSTAKERMIEEIEQILSRASEEELVEFLQGRSFDHHTDAIAQIAYGAFARISPERAAESWLAERVPQGFANSPSSFALMREWVKRDPAAADRWIEEHAHEEGMDSVRKNYYTMIAGTNPAGALALLPEVDPEKGYSFARVLGENLDLSQLPAAAEQFRDQSEKGSNTSNMVGTFLSAWGERDPESMREWLFTQDLDALGSDVVVAALGDQIRNAPDELLVQIGPALHEHAALRDAAASAWWQWIAIEGKEAEAIQWLFSQKDSSQLVGSFQNARYTVHYDPFGYWKGDRAKSILDSLAAAPDSRGKEWLNERLLGSLAESEPQLVIAYAMKHLPLGQKADSVISSAVHSWAKEEPETALRWSLENIESDSAQRQSVNSAFRSWAQTDAPAAAAALEDLPEKLRNSASYQLASSWARQDPDGFLDYLNSVSDPSAAAAVAQNGYRFLAERYRPERYLDHSLKMPQGKLRHQAVRGLFSGWAQADVEGGAKAVDRIPEGSLRNAAIQGFNSYAVRKAPETAFDLATRIGAPRMRRGSMISAGRAWMKQNPDQARSSIQSNTAISDEVKAEILKGSQ